MNISMEKTIAYGLLVPMGSPDLALGGPNDPGCVWGLPFYFEGAPAVAKSARVRAGGRLADLPVEVVMPAHHLPEDFSGVPVMNPGTGELTMECILNGVRRLLRRGSNGLFFVDELNWARPAVQGALLRAVHERQIGDIILPPEVRIMLAGNPPDVAGGGWELIPPLANRMAHVKVLPPTYEEWTDWLNGRGSKEQIGLVHGEELVRLYWDEMWAKARGVMTGFMQRRGSDVLYDLPPEGHPNRGAAWPSPRTWEFATRALATCLALDQSKTKVKATVEVEEEEEENKKKDDKKKSKRKSIEITAANLMAHHLIEACVGQAAAAQWVTWLAEANLPDPEDVLDNGWEIDRHRLDRVVAVLSSTTNYTLSRRDEDERVRRAIQLWHLLDRVCATQFRDLVVPASEQLSRTKPFALDSSFTASPDLVQISSKVSLSLGRSGLLK